jgi:Pathogenicity locus
MIEDRTQYTRLEQLPNVGKATAGDFRLLGITEPHQLIGRDPYALFEDLCARTGHRHDPCCIDVFIAAVRFMEGAPSAPWWAYTAERKRVLQLRETRSVSA